MNIIFKLIEFILYSGLIVFITKNFLVKVLRKLAEAIDLKAQTVGNIAGFATSMPELISVFFTSIQGMFTTGLVNILSSNIINLIQYITSIYKNKNQKFLQNTALKLDMILVVTTILIPLIVIIFGIEFNIIFAPIFIILFAIFYVINKNMHKLYLSDIKIENYEDIEEEKRWVKGKKKVIIKNIIYLICIGIILFIIGELLGNVVKKMSEIYDISETIIGIALGFITSIPELITFIESQRHSKKHNNDMHGVIEATNNLLISNMINLFVVVTIGILVMAII